MRVNMNIDTKPELGLWLPKGKNIYPTMIKLLVDRGIDMGEERKNGSLHGTFQNYSGKWTQADSKNIIPEIARGLTPAGFVGSDFYADYMASLKPGESPAVVELLRFQLFKKGMKVCVVGRQGEDYHSPADFRDRRFIGRYESLMRKFLRPFFAEDKEMPVEIDTSIGGGEEGFVKGHHADYAMVIVSTGDSLRRNGLIELATVEEHIQPVFVANLQAIQEMGFIPSLDEMVDRLQNGRRGSRKWSDLPTTISKGVSSIVTTVLSIPFSKIE